MWLITWFFSIGLRLSLFVGLKTRSDGETLYLYSAIHRRFVASRISVAPRSLYVRSRSHRGHTYIGVFCVFCTFRVFRPTYPFFKNTLLLERVHIRGTGARRTTLSRLLAFFITPPYTPMSLGQWKRNKNLFSLFLKAWLSLYKLLMLSV